MSLYTQTLDRAIRKCEVKDAVNGSVEEFFEMMVGKTKPQVEKIVREAKGNPNADKAYQKWKKIYTKDAAPKKSRDGYPYKLQIQYANGQFEKQLCKSATEAQKMKENYSKKHGIKAVKIVKNTDAKPRRSKDKHYTVEYRTAGSDVFSDKYHKEIVSASSEEEAISKVLQSKRGNNIIGRPKVVDSKPMKDAPNYSKRIEGLKNEVKNKPGNIYVVYEITTLLGKTQETRGVKLKASTEAEAIKKYKQDYMKGPNKESRKCKAVKVQDSKPRRK